MALGGLFKGKQERQFEWDMAIQNVLDLPRRRIKDLNKHEHGYCEKAIRAKRQGDKGNYEEIAKLLVQTKEKIEGYGQFAKGLQAATKSISAVFKNIDFTNMASELNMAMGRANA